MSTSQTPPRPLLAQRLVHGIGIVVLALLSQGVRAGTVTNTNDSGPGSLRQEIANAAPGDTIGFAASVTGTITLTTGQVAIDKNLTLQGPGADVLAISGNNSARVFIIAAGSPSVTFAGLTISNGRSTGGAGGAIFDSSSGLLTISKCVVSGNAAFAEGAIHKGTVGASSFSIADSTISGNMALSDDSGGIGISGATGTITNCTISGNSAINHAGGIYVNTGSNVTITSCTITNNSITGGNGPGGGIQKVSGATARIRNTIIAGNSAQLAASQDVSGAFISDGYNVIGKGDGGSGFSQSTDQVGSNAVPLDAHLNPLQNNGGTTQTHALAAGSSAIDKGNSFGVSADQRGSTRPVDNPGIPNATGGDGSDIGAFEAAGGSSGPTILANISTRLRVETGDNALIGGFIVTGTQPKKIIVRAIGPSLPFGGTLADPTLELRDSSGGLIASNDNWRSDHEAEIIATTIPPTNDLESAIVATLPANNSAYTAIVRGANNGTGIGVVEAYDLDQTATSTLANISTRGLVQTGDNVLIGGLIVLGQNPLQVIVRAIGPSSPVPGALADPTLELRDGNGALLASNDNWRSDQEAEIIATTVPPSNDLESAIVRNLTPGNYTAIVRGVNSTTGIAVVEAYALHFGN